MAVRAAQQRYATALQRYAVDLFDGNDAAAERLLREVWRGFAVEGFEQSEDRVREELFVAVRRSVTRAQRAAGVAERFRTEESGAELASLENGTETPLGTVQRLFSRLTPKQQELLRLKFRHDFNVVEIARIMELSPMHTAQLLHVSLSRICAALRVHRTEESQKLPEDLSLTLEALGEATIEGATGASPDHTNSLLARERLNEVQRTAQLVEAVVRRRVAGSRSLRARAPKIARIIGLLTVLALLAAGAWWGWQSAAVERASEAAQRGAESERVHVRETDDHTTSNDGVESVAADTSFSQGRQTHAGSTPKRGASLRRADALGDAPIADVSASRHEVPAGESAPSATSTVSSEPAAQARGESGELAGGNPLASFRGARAAVRPEQEALHQPTSEGEEVAPASVASDASATVTPSPRPSEPATVARVGEDPTKSDSRPPRVATPAPPSERDVTRSAAHRDLQRALASEKWPTPTQVAAAKLGERGMPESDAQLAGPTFSLAIEAAEVPWEASRRVVRVTARAPTQANAARPRINVVFLLDVSGSMATANRLPLVQEAVARVVEALEPQDRVGIVTYAGEAQTMLPSVRAQEKGRIARVLQALVARGQTNGGAGLVEAFALAEAGGNDAGPAVVLWCTDGEFNVGQTSDAALGNLIDEQARSGVRLAIFGFGRSARIDPRLESLAARAQGGSGYVNTSAEAAAVLLAQLQPMLEPVATDARLTVEFNPLRAVQPRGWTRDGRRSVEQAEVFPGEAMSLLCDYAPDATARVIDELLHVRFVNQPVGAAVLPLHEARWDDAGRTFAQASAGFRFAVLGERLGELLRRGAGTPEAEWTQLHRLIEQHLPHDAGGYRTELLELVERARGLVR